MFSFTSGITIVIEEYSGSMIKATRQENEINLNVGKEEVKIISKAVDMTIYTLGEK